MRPDDVGLGGFDSHALPPRGTARFARRLWPVLSLVAALSSLWPSVASAQQADSARAGLAPPISPRRAFFYSLAIPGLGQATLDRPLVGAGFFLVEAFAVAVLHRSVDDLRLARAYERDSIPARYAFNPETGVPQLDGRGNPVVAAWEPAYYSPALTRARRLQVEDWSAVLVFNHLIAGAEAFVAAQLWDLPQHVTLRVVPTRQGMGVAARLSVR